MLGQRGTSSCPGRRRARRCRCRPWRSRARPAARRAPRRARPRRGRPCRPAATVEIAVADMTDDRRDQPALGDVALGLGDAFGQPRDRHADIGRDRLGARAQRQRRPSRRRAAPARAGCAPPARVAHSNGPPPNSRGDLAEPLRLLGDARLGAVEFEEQHRRLGEGRASNRRCTARTCSASSSSMRATGMPDWMVAIDGVAGGLDGRERADAAGDRLRDAVQLQRQLGDDAERAFGADQQPGEVVAGGGLASRAAPSSPPRRSAITALSASTLSFMVP